MPIDKKNLTISGNTCESTPSKKIGKAEFIRENLLAKTPLDIAGWLESHMKIVFKQKRILASFLTCSIKMLLKTALSLSISSEANQTKPYAAPTHARL